MTSSYNDDEELGRLKEEENKKINEEYQEVTNPKPPKLLGSQLIDNLYGRVGEIGQSIVKASEDDPDTWTDDMIRLGLGGAKNVGNVLNAPGIKQALQALGAPAWVVGQGLGWTLEKAGVDPRYGHIAGEVGEWFIPFYGAGKLVKKAKQLSTNVSRLADMTPMQRALASGTVGAAKPVYKKTDILKQALTDTINNKPIIGSPESVRGTASQRMGAAVNRLKEEGWVRRDGSIRELPNRTSRARGRTGNADLVNALSDRKTWRTEGKKRIEAIVNNLTERERRLAGKWHLHHKRPLSQHSWLTHGLEGDELVKAHQYSYQRMAAGGDVLNNQRVVFDKAHDATHRYMNSAIGEMRSGAGKSISGLLDPGVDPQDFIKLKTFEERKYAFSRFFDITDAADLKTQHIIDALNAASTKGATISLQDANYILNKLDFGAFNKIDDVSDIAILDEFLIELNKLMDPDDINSLVKINEALNWNDAEYIRIATLLDAAQSKNKIKSLQRELNQLELDAKNLMNRKEALIPQQARRRLDYKLERSQRGGTPGGPDLAPGMFPDD